MLNTLAQQSLARDSSQSDGASKTSSAAMHTFCVASDVLIHPKQPGMCTICTKTQTPSTHNSPHICPQTYLKHAENVVTTLVVS
jgi:hypothetical protein